MAPRTQTLRRRNEIARSQGWDSYAQKRYWLTSGRIGPRRLWATGDEITPTLRALAAECCHDANDRPGSLMCTSCNAKVNPRHESRGAAGVATWRARLVRAARQSRTRSRAARKGWRTRKAKR